MKNGLKEKSRDSKRMKQECEKTCFPGKALFAENEEELARQNKRHGEQEAWRARGMESERHGPRDQPWSGGVGVFEE